MKIDITQSDLHEWANTSPREYAAALAHDGSWKRFVVVQPLYADPRYVVRVGSKVVHESDSMADAIQAYNEN
jgi:hypothetical protein